MRFLRITIKTNEQRTRTYTQQKINITIQRTNAGPIMRTFLESETEKMEEVFYLV